MRPAATDLCDTDTPTIAGQPGSRPTTVSAALTEPIDLGVSDFDRGTLTAPLNSAHFE